ncbi:hypothetical protein PsAD2_03206 [Pseudovibrio axinellae]|uniref:Uncharacterized protein n=1 Tax=Pseudovibrio axinellae TaxID=989403 RepID=A0A165X000_9HYPH|nr:hypothetical protein PsAD2_03206 [Pseudovibrio axinellae]
MIITTPVDIDIIPRTPFKSIVALATINDITS